MQNNRCSFFSCKVLAKDVQECWSCMRITHRSQKNLWVKSGSRFWEYCKLDNAPGRMLLARGIPNRIWLLQGIPQDRGGRDANYGRSHAVPLSPATPPPSPSQPASSSLNRDEIHERFPPVHNEAGVGWFLCRAPIRHPADLVRIRGLEPPLPCENMDLNHARLPIPPYPHMLVGLSILQRALPSVKFWIEL